MAHIHEATPHDERESKKPITLGQFLRDTWQVPAAWLGGAAIGFLYAKQRGYKTGTLQQQYAVGIPAKIGAFAAFFMIWQKNEKQRFGIEDIYENYKEARSTRMDNDALRKENELLKDMVAYENRHVPAHHDTPKHVQEIVAHGPKGHEEHAMQETGLAANR